ncbi:alkene reductase [Vibrio sp.]|uniref:alkene reductase n=1 Tax=Vibrio sp. TaxID=678 RepID=UPI003AA8FDE8
MSNSLFTPIQFGDLTLNNRIVMPPMTRSRAKDGCANAMMAEYYAQRAEAGLIISEGTQISQLGQGYAWTPGIYSPEQVQGWKLVTDAVHAKGGKIFAQLWHVGRVTHPSNTGGVQPISSSEQAAKGVKVFIDEKDQPNFVDTVLPRAMTHDDIEHVKEEFHQAALNALEAGFDGVELHAANGYLVNQFIDSEANLRDDEYGGSTENRLRFLGEVVDQLVAVVGKERVGVRLAPFTCLNGTVDSDPETTYVEAAKLLNSKGIGYIHIAEVDWDDAPDTPISFKQNLRQAFDQTIILAGKYNPEKAQQALEQGFADMVAFGRPFVANPDLVTRIKNQYPLAEHNPDTLFGGAEQGLTDYPVYSEA